MFERFTERARQVVVLAQQETRHRARTMITTESILMGLLLEEESLGCRVLEGFDITIERVRSWRGDHDEIGPQKDPNSQQLPFSHLAKKVLELALREALSLGHNYIGTEHILLGLVRLPESVGSQILLDFEVNSEKIRNEVIRMLSGPGRAEREIPGLPTAPIRNAVEAQQYADYINKLTVTGAYVAANSHMMRAARELAKWVANDEAKMVARFLESGEVLEVWLDTSGGAYSKSVQPHPLLTIDYDTDDRPVKMVMVGALARVLGRIERA